MITTVGRYHGQLVSTREIRKQINNHHIPRPIFYRPPPLSVCPRMYRFSRVHIARTILLSKQSFLVGVYLQQHIGDSTLK